MDIWKNLVGVFETLSRYMVSKMTCCRKIFLIFPLKMGVIIKYYPPPQLFSAQILKLDCTESFLNEVLAVTGNK